jgi:hypothetical protein
VIHVLRRLMTVREIPLLPQENELECLREIRFDMAASYPRIRVFRIFRILRKFRVRRLPVGLLIDASSLGVALMKLFKAQVPRLARRMAWHPLFDSGAYLALYPDVASSRAAPWLHYQVFGRVEARTPHPFIDVDILSASMLGVPIGEVVDRYLALPETWTLDSSAYVDCQRFLLSGQWDGRSHPLVQLLTTQLHGPWVHHRLLLTDSTVADVNTARRIAVSTLLAKAGVTGRTSEFKLWLEDPDVSQNDATAGLYTVIPGFFLGLNGTALVANSAQVLSADASMIRLNGEFIGRVVGQVIKAQQLAYLNGPLSKEALRELLRGSPEDTVIAPSSMRQQLAVQLLIDELGCDAARVLEVGRQTRIQVEKVSIIAEEATSPTEIELPVKNSVDATMTALIVPRNRGVDIASDLELMALIQAGALLCLSHNDSIVDWVPLLRTRNLVLVTEDLVPAVRGLIDDHTLRILPFAARQGES